MRLQIEQRVIDADMHLILEDIQSHSRYLNDIIDRGENIGITCPFHKDGQERHPSCYVYAVENSDDVPYGYFKCFTCGEQGSLIKLVSHCLGLSIEQAKEWLIDNYSSTYIESLLKIPEINLKDITKKEKIKVLDDEILDNYKYIHPYLLKRGVSEEIIKRFNVGWDSLNNAVTFPVRDIKGRLMGITSRNVDYKHFHIPEGMDKHIYLLHYIVEHNIKSVTVVESQIDALYLWSLGYPAIALLGTGSKEQYDILKKSGIISYHLALDGDKYGQKGIRRFIDNMQGVFIDKLMLDEKDDINDLTAEEIKKLFDSAQIVC